MADKNKITTVKDLKEEIESLERDYADLAKLYNYFDSPAGVPEDVRLLIEEKAGTGKPVAKLCFDASAVLKREIDRLKRVIDETAVDPDKISGRK